jgi:hypothetical protein
MLRPSGEHMPGTLRTKTSVDEQNKQMGLKGDGLKKLTGVRSSKCYREGLSCEGDGRPWKL